MMKHYPNAIQDSHMENDVIVFDRWECLDHPETPTIAEMNQWQSECELEKDKIKSIEILVQDKIRYLAMEALKADGMTDNHGEITEAGIQKKDLLKSKKG